jgi:hypothetical protein
MPIYPIYPSDMDVECMPLCDALNNLKGITTVESCCGHGKRTFGIAFLAYHVEHLKPLLVALDEMTSWNVSAKWASGGDGIYFWLEGPIGGYDEANALAKKLLEV